MKLYDFFEGATDEQVGKCWVLYNSQDHNRKLYTDYQKAYYSKPEFYDEGEEIVIIPHEVDKFPVVSYIETESIMKIYVKANI